MSQKRKPGQPHKGWKKSARNTLSTGAKSALTRSQGGFSRYNIGTVKGGAKVAPITLPHADKLAEIGRKLEESDVLEGR